MFTKLNLKTKYEKYILLGTGISTMLIGSYFNDKFLKRRKGIRKMAQVIKDSVGKDSMIRLRELKNQIETGEEMQLYHASIISYFKFYFYTPYAIIFPKRLESIQKIMKIANKYDIAVMNIDLNDINDYDIEIPQSIFDQESVQFFSNRPFVVVNQKNIDQIDFDEENLTCNVGVGCSFVQVNQILNEKGYHIPIKDENKNERIFTLLNENNIILQDSEYKNLGELIQSVRVVLPDGKALLTTPNEQKQPFSFGVDFQNLFVGQNADYGLLVDATFKVQPIKKYLESNLTLNNEYITQNNLYYLLKGMQDILNYQTSVKHLFLNYDQQSHDLNIIAKYTDEIDIRQLLNQYINPFVYQEMWQDSLINTVPMEQKQHKYILQYTLDSKSLIKTMLNIQQLPKLDMLSQMNIYVGLFIIITIDIKNNILTIGIDYDVTDISFFRMISSYIRHQNGRFLYCNNLMVNNLLKQEAIPEECGLNHVFLQHQLKKWLDPKNILINKSLIYEIG